MKVSELGEFGLIELLAEIVSRASASEKAPQPLLGIGDDAAAWHTEASLQLATTDTLVQDVHFTLGTATWEELGWKALAVNISDIAAMGGLPSYALVSLGLPGETEVDGITKLYEGMTLVARQYDVAIVGGDVIRAPLVIISLVVIGRATGDNILIRSAALPGDQIAVTGYLGASAAGLKMLTNRLEFDRETTALLREAHLRPHPRVAEGNILAQHGVRAAIDLSDGLVSDLGKVCQASGVGARVQVDKIPVHPMVRANFGDNSIELALSGGEDYELLFTCKIGLINQIKKLMPSPITVIGEVTSDQPGQVTLLDEKGGMVRLGKEGWDHFPRVSRGDYQP